MNKCLENAEYLYDQLQRRTHFELVLKNKVRLVVTGHRLPLTSFQSVCRLVKFHLSHSLTYDCKYIFPGATREEMLTANCLHVICC